MVKLKHPNCFQRLNKDIYILFPCNTSFTDETTENGIVKRTKSDADGDGIPDHLEKDTDGDGIPDHLDEDDDGDGITDHLDSSINKDISGSILTPDAELDSEGVSGRRNEKTSDHLVTTFNELSIDTDESDVSNRVSKITLNSDPKEMHSEESSKCSDSSDILGDDKTVKPNKYYLSDDSMLHKIFDYVAALIYEGPRVLPTRPSEESSQTSHTVKIPKKKCSVN